MHFTLSDYGAINGTRPTITYTLLYYLPSTPPLSADMLLDAMLVGVAVTEASPIPESELKVKKITLW